MQPDETTRAPHAATGLESRPTRTEIAEASLLHEARLTLGSLYEGFKWLLQQHPEHEGRLSDMTCERVEGVLAQLKEADRG